MAGKNFPTKSARRLLCTGTDWSLAFGPKSLSPAISFPCPLFPFPLSKLSYSSFYPIVGGQLFIDVGLFAIIHTFFQSLHFIIFDISFKQGTFLTRWLPVFCFCRHLRPRCAARTRCLSLSAARLNLPDASRRNSQTWSREAKNKREKQKQKQKRASNPAHNAEIAR